MIKSYVLHCAQGQAVKKKTKLREQFRFSFSEGVDYWALKHVVCSLLLLQNLDVIKIVKSNLVANGVAHPVEDGPGAGLAHAVEALEVGGLLLAELVHLLVGHRHAHRGRHRLAHHLASGEKEISTTLFVMLKKSRSPIFYRTFLFGKTELN